MKYELMYTDLDTAVEPYILEQPLIESQKVLSNGVLKI
jgi:hypothetical protein